MAAALSTIGNSCQCGGLGRAAGERHWATGAEFATGGTVQQARRFAQDRRFGAAFVRIGVRLGRDEARGIGMGGGRQHSGGGSILDDTPHIGHRDMVGDIKECVEREIAKVKVTWDSLPADSGIAGAEQYRVVHIRTG